ncbi:ribonuclease PH [Ruficoccus amylovorans]|uniref:Ribonuclease PH n=1 Tax=Ruficoccus amylovorans TaxID=1804625 RepID=A0A842HHZ7_9BACT|nr:ribonuclease PH [Ruficoccus amylovorans]MBC2596395.1 ribonuclease PH [Ruficoccus amylovorans]
MSTEKRLDGRLPHELRPLSFEPGFAPHATGSVLACFGNTRVICAATLEKRVPGWMREQGVEGGWITAEYSMLPYSTHDRKARDIAKGRLDGRSVEIQRLIGRSMRAVVDLKKLPGYTLWIDCDVLQADGGTRTASISGAYVASQLAVRRLMADGVLAESPFTDSVAAVSVGIFHDLEIADLNYHEDREASVDFNIVMTGGGQYVEVQGTGEEATFSSEQLARLLDMGKHAVAQITARQAEVLG